MLNHHFCPRPSLRSGLTPVLLSAVAAALSAAALVLNPAEAATAAATAQYQAERQACLNGQTNQDRATCLKEVGAAFAEARRGGLTSATVSAEASNASKRCEPLPAAERVDCYARMQGAGSVSGSVVGGGIIRELVTVEVGSAASAASGSKTGK